MSGSRQLSASQSPRRAISRSPSRLSFQHSPSPLPASHEPFAAANDETPVQLDYKPQFTLRGHKKAVSDVKISPDGARIASCSADGTIKIWNAQTGQHEHTFEGHLAGVSVIAWSPDSRWIASGADDKVIRLWDVTMGKPHPYPFLGHSNYISSLAFSPKGNILASGSHDEAVFLWDVRAARRIRSLPAHSDPVGGVDFTHDGTLIVSCSSDGLIRIWDTSTGQCLRTIIHEDHAPVMSVKFSPNGKYVLAWTLDSSIRLWNYVEHPGRCVKTYQGHTNKKFGITGTFGTYSRYEAMYQTENDKYTEKPSALMVSGSEDGSLWIWDVGNKKILQTIENAHDGVVFAADAHHKARQVVSGGADGLVKVWKHNIQTADRRQVFPKDDLDDEHQARMQDPTDDGSRMELDDAVVVKREDLQ
ncbi:WD40 repeat-like protein [Microthyrium microscopicum]|uniref:Mitochondrial division protein 1 n=1 Tax=Microthyrium microscopicum TaxID=703497 RepID=A0A6A6UJC4_9PEZI|nr:WD40 repeat-like protein [Microthyrium microscopicum]